MGRDVVIQLEAVSKYYGERRLDVPALVDVTLTVHSGEFVSVMGPSGSGKSTLLNLVAGLDTPTRGRVMLLGQDMAHLPSASRNRLRLRRVGIVFQTFHLFPSFTTEENVAWPLEFLGFRASAAKDRARETLARVDIDVDQLSRRPAQLSQGEQQRVAIARALATEPALLLADEPTGNLDSRTGKAILDLLRDLNRERNLSVILVTHSAFAATYGHRTIELQDGRVVHDVRAPRDGPGGPVLTLREV